MKYIEIEPIELEHALCVDLFIDVILLLKPLYNNIITIFYYPREILSNDVRWRQPTKRVAFFDVFFSPPYVFAHIVTVRFECHHVLPSAGIYTTQDTTHRIWKEKRTKTLKKICLDDSTTKQGSEVQNRGFTHYKVI